MLGLVWAEPARCFGAAVVSGGHLWFGHWIFGAGPALACVVFCASTQIIPNDHLHAEGYRHDFKASQGLWFASFTPDTYDKFFQDFSRAVEESQKKANQVETKKTAEELKASRLGASEPEKKLEEVTQE
ncbi:hypothetical protein ACH5RR_021945 [Cinchona calisaya]|uniref:Uncharacterized protein n=1 Tax=Cinchona calisaya TaxID=153742 RepID=A0ABD2Z6D6_9GENT